MARRRKTQLELPTTALVGDGVDAQVTSDAPAEVQAIAPVRAWTVARDARVSLFGQLTVLPAGSRVSAAEYGPDGVARIVAQGVELVPA